MQYLIILDKGDDGRRVMGDSDDLGKAIKYADAIGEEFSQMGTRPSEVCMVVEDAQDTMHVTQTWLHGHIVRIESKGI